jgi:hypothetical protein
VRYILPAFVTERIFKRKRTMTMLLTTALCVGIALAQAPAKAADKKAAAGSSSADELRQIENDWTAAEKARDADKLAEILSDGWVGVEWDGKVIDKAAALADIKTPGNSLGSFEMGPMKVRFFRGTPS